jgi:tetratricopeptide (TPR) repeat protein
MRAVCPIVASVILFISHGAFAQSEDIAQLKKEGTAAFEQKDWTTALQKFEQAYALSKDPTFLYNQARTLESAQELPRALDAIEEFERLAAPELKAKVNGLDQVVKGIRDRVVTLVVRANIADAEVRVNDRVMQKTALPETRIRVTRGPISFSVVKESYYPCTKLLTDLQAAETREITCELASRSTRGFLSVKSTSGATVAIDGAPRGMVPFEGDLIAGTHAIELSKDGYEPFRSSLAIAAGESKQFAHDLDKTPSITGKWWFWTGIGVVVAAGVVTVVALSTERTPDKGTIQPGTIRTGAFRF